MAATTPPSVTALPTPPQRSDAANFATRGDAFLAALPTFQTETNAVATNAYNNAVESFDSATDAAVEAAAALVSQGAAAASATAAANSAGAALWVSGTTYAIGDVRRSPVNFFAYYRKTTGAGTTDPSADTTNWALAAGALPVQITVTGTTAAATANADYLLTNAAATTVTLPASPTDGDPVWVTIGNGRADNVINPNGKDINGVAGSMTLNRLYGSVLLRYSATLGDWRTR